MNRLKAGNILLSAFLAFLSSPADAQFNLKSGYSISFFSDDGFDQLISAYNASEEYTSGFKKLRWLHGFEAGVRYKSGLQSLEAGYQGAYQTIKGTRFPNGVETEDRIRVAIHSAEAGYQLSDRSFGAGTDLQLQFHKVRFIPGDNSPSFKNIQRIWAMKFYLMLILKGKKGVDVTFQPYYILPFRSYDMVALSQFFHVSPAPESTKWNRWGLSILFYNGKK